MVTAPPGAGKSTVLPLTLLEAFPEGKILMLEPRRVAARSIALRMAWLLGENVGETVGYRVRFDSRVSARTRVEVLTEGILTRMLIEDPALEGVSCVIFDEFHERSLQCDEALALIRESAELLRPELRLLLMSATIDADALCRELDAGLIECEGKMYPVEVHNSLQDTTPENVVELTSRAVFQALRECEGDILVFLPGEGEIFRCEALLRPAVHDGTEVFTLYGRQSPSEQEAAMAPTRDGCRKIVLSTPVAETSLTIEGVRVVIDSGFCRTPVFNPQTALSRLETVRISRDMADQRTGRAGRVAPGVCFRLYSKGTESRMAQTRTPEILEADLSSLVLDIAAWGEPDPTKLPWLTPPPKAQMLQAEDILRSLGAFDGNGTITEKGRALSAYPCHPRIAGLLLQSRSLGSEALAADLAAFLEERDPMSAEPSVDLSMRIDRMREERGRGNSRRWSRTIASAKAFLKMTRTSKEDNSAVDPFAVGELLAEAYPERIAATWGKIPGQYLLSTGDIVAIDPSDPMSGYEYIVAPSLSVRPGIVGKVFLAAPLSKASLSGHLSSHEVIVWDARRGEFRAEKEYRVGTILVQSEQLSGPEYREKMTEALVEASESQGESMYDFSDEARNLQRRIAAVAAWHPELELPPVDTASVLARAGEWVPLFAAGCRKVQDTRKVDMAEVIWSLIPYEKKAVIERLAPSHIEVPTGSRIRIEYRHGAEAPVLKVRLQECFGLTDTPCVDDGLRPVLIELLSPGYKPVQLTSDLKSFWNGTYFEVRKELKRRYPKHYWPDNPLEAAPVRGIKKS